MGADAGLLSAAVVDSDVAPAAGFFAPVVASGFGLGNGCLVLAAVALSGAGASAAGCATSSS